LFLIASTLLATKKIAYHNSRNVGRNGLEVFQRGCPRYNEDVNDEKEDTKEDTEGATYPGQQHVLLAQDTAQRLGLQVSVT
jgi:hypothetical protein